MVNIPLSHREIIDRYGGPAALAHRIGEPPNNVKAWKRMDSIPAPYWARIAAVEAATLDELAAAAARKREADPEQEAA